MFRFGDYSLDVEAHTLRCGDRVMYLRPKTFETLCYLVEHRGKVLRKDDLLEHVWSGVVVTDGTLIHCVEEIRAALEDDSHHPRYVQTLPRVGYRFIAEVTTAATERREEEIEEEVVTEFALRVHDTVATDPEDGHHGTSSHQTLVGRALRKQTVGRVVAMVALILVVSILLFVLLGRKDNPPRVINALAVLPFTNLSGDPGQQYFAEGLTDLLTTEVSRIRGLRVISRGSAALSSGEKGSLQDVGRRLQVDAVIEGSVFRSGDRVLITAQLIDIAQGRHLWGESYEGDLGEVVPTLRQVTRSIAGEIRANLTSQELATLSKGGRTDPVAYEAYLKGRYHWNRRNDDEFKKAIVYFQQAIERDSSYAPAYAGLADCYNMLGNYDVIMPAEAYPKAKTAAMKALALDPSLADAHASLAFALMEFDWNWNEAEKEYEQAVALNPNYVSAHHWFGLLHAMHGRFADAEREMKTARLLDPLSLIVLTNTGWVRYFAGDYKGAAEILRDCLQLDPNFISAHIKLGWTYEAMGRTMEGVAEFQEAVRLTRGDRSIRLMLAHAQAANGQLREAARTVNAALSGSDTTYVPAFHVAVACIALGRMETAFTFLKKAVKERSGWLCWLKVDPKLARLRADPRFTALVDSLRL